jgi:hypothetical protein
MMGPGPHGSTARAIGSCTSVMLVSASVCSSEPVSLACDYAFRSVHHPPNHRPANEP